MVQMTIEMPEEVLAALCKDPENFARELRLAAAVKWYELKMLSQERAAKVAGLSRAEFLGCSAGLGSRRFSTRPKRSSRKPSVNEVWVVNASPMIVLAKVGHLQLLEQLPGELRCRCRWPWRSSPDPAPTRPGKPWRAAGASESLPAAFPPNS